MIGADSEDYDKWIVGCLKNCRCCRECDQDRPCAGVMAGWICDDACDALVKVLQRYREVSA